MEENISHTYYTYEDFHETYNYSGPDYLYPDYLYETESIIDYDYIEMRKDNCTSCHCHESFYIYYIDGIALLIVAIFGIIGTIMSMIVLLKPRIRDFFSSFLIALSVFDGSFLIMAIFYIGLPAMSCQFRNVFPRIMPILHGLIHLARSGSVFVTMAVTLERYFAIVYPFKDFKLKKGLLPIAIFFAILYNIPKFFEFHTIHFSGDQYQFYKTSLREDPYYITFYVFWSKVIFMEIIPYILIISLNGCIIKNIVSSFRFRKQFTQSSSQHHQNKRVLSVKVTMDDNSIIRTESSYQTMNEPLPDIIHTCRTDTPRNVSPIEPQLSQRAQTPDQTNNKQTCQLSQRAQTPDQTNNRQTSQLRNQRSRSYANALRLQPNDQDMHAGNVSSMESESVLQLSKMKLMSKEFDMGLTLAGISLMFVLCQSIKLVVDIYELMVCDHFKIAKEGHDPKCHNPIKIDIIASFGNLFVCINSAANFLLYMVKGEKFRDAFCQTYFSCKSSNVLPNHSTNLTMTSRTNSISIRKNYSTKNDIN